MRIGKTHVCKKVRTVSNKNGVPYDGDRAIACSQFESVDITEANL